MTALLIFGIIALVVTFAFGVSITVLVSRALSRAFLTLDQMHERNAEHVDGLLDRLMTIRWEDYVSVKATTEDEVGDFFAPSDEADELDQEEPGRWGPLSRLRERTRLTQEEEDIIGEDFGSDGEPRRAEA